MHGWLARFVLCLSLTLCVGANASFAHHPQEAELPYRWSNVAVGGGGFAPAMVFSPAERDLAYLRTDMGGAYRWDARLSRWIPLQDDETVSSFMGIESIAPDPTDPKIVYMAAGMGSWGPAAIFRSHDRGTSWQKTRVPFLMGGNERGRGLGERLAVDPHNPAHLLFGSRHDGLWQSRNSGVSWNNLDVFPLAGQGTPASSRQTHGGLSFVLFDPVHAGRIFVGSADREAPGLFISRDAARSWNAVNGGPPDGLLPVKAALGSDGIVTITYSDDIGPNGIARGAVWRYDPVSSQWADITPDKRPDAPKGGYMGVAVSAADPAVIAVSTMGRFEPGDTVWRSADAGRSWTELRHISTRDISTAPFLAFDEQEAEFGHWIAGLAIDPFDPGHAAYTTGATVYSTRDFGSDRAMEWTPWVAGVEQTAVITLVSPAAGAPLVSGFGDLGGFRHDDLDRSPPHLHRNPFLSNTNSLDYAGLAPKVMVRSGNTHANTVPDTSLAWSDDGATSWQPLRVPGANRLPPTAPLRTGNAAITVSADGKTFLVEAATPLLTRDRGVTWHRVSGLPAGSRVTADKSDPTRFYAIDFAADSLLHSSDGGLTFKPLESTGLPRQLDGARADGREAPNSMLSPPGHHGALWLLIGETLYRSADFGATWHPANIDIAIERYGLGKAAPDQSLPTVFAIATKGGERGVYRSIDGGRTWQKINDAAHRWGLRFRMIAGDPRRHGRVYIATDGRGILYGDPADGE